MVDAVIAKAKQTGDYGVLSQADLLVLALTYSLHQKDLKEKEEKSQTITESSAPSETSEVGNPAVHKLPHGNLVHRRW